jgi:hypothetical protein
MTAKMVELKYCPERDMTQTLLEEIWDETFEKLSEKPNFEAIRIDQIKQLVKENKLTEVESVLTKKYENQDTSN